MSEVALKLQNITKMFGDFKAVDDISLEIPEGSIYGFLGPNGSGKTTTIRIILEIIRPTQGSVAVLGNPSALQVRDRIGYLPEEKGLYKKMKAWSVIAYFASLKGMAICTTWKGLAVTAAPVPDCPFMGQPNEGYAF